MFKGVNFVNFVDYEKIKNFQSNFWLNALRIKSGRITKKKILDYLNESGLQCRPVWDLLHTLPHLSKYKSYQIKGSTKLFNDVILLPSSPGLIK